MKHDKMEHKTESPLRWPEGWGRTLIEHRKSRSAWKKPVLEIQTAVLTELSRLKVSAATISYNEPGSQRMDPGVAVWFSIKQAEDFSWQTGLHLDSPAPTIKQIDEAYRELAMKHHPDRGGDIEMFKRLTGYRDKAKAWVLGNAAPVMDNCVPCDRFTEVRQNLAAVRMALAAFRQLDRVGIPAILERVMTQAFKAQLPVGGAINVP